MNERAIQAMPLEETLHEEGGADVPEQFYALARPAWPTKATPRLPLPKLRRLARHEKGMNLIYALEALEILAGVAVTAFVLWFGRPRH